MEMNVQNIYGIENYKTTISSTECSRCKTTRDYGILQLFE